MPDNQLRVLFVGFNREYVNRTAAVLLRAIQARHDLSFFGPGYQNREQLEAGPEAWIDRNGPYDLLLFDSYVLEHDAVARRARPFAGDCIHFDIQEFHTYGPGLQRFVHKYREPKVFIANWDVYSVSESRIAELEASGAFVMDQTLSRLTVKEKEDAFNSAIAAVDAGKGFWGGAANDNWVNFAKRNNARMLEVPHAIGLDQTSERPLQLRRYRLSVPGTSYQERAALYQLLTYGQKVKQFHSKVNDKLYFRLRTSLSPHKLRSLHTRYDGEISNSRMAYTSGSLHRTPVRKYFEIPALGAMPLGQKCEGFSDLGFRDGENFVIAETAEDVRNALHDHDGPAAQVIAENARKLVMERHSVTARAQQLAQSFALIAAGEFKGSYWHDGEYCHR